MKAFRSLGGRKVHYVETTNPLEPPGKAPHSGDTNYPETILLVPQSSQKGLVTHGGVEWATLSRHPLESRNPVTKQMSRGTPLIGLNPYNPQNLFTKSSLD